MLTLTPQTKSAVVRPSTHTTIATRRINMARKREVVPGERVYLQIQSVGEAVDPKTKCRVLVLHCVTALHGDDVMLKAFLSPDGGVKSRPFFLGYESTAQALAWELPEKYKDWGDFMKQAWKEGSEKPKLVMGIGLPADINLSEMKRVR
jgi:hypothetical protein